MTDRRMRLDKSSSLHEDLSSSSTSSFSSDDETDRQKNLKPIKDYLHNRQELAKQLFMSVKMEKIKMMLPQLLKKKMDMEELQELCASELSGMSRTRIQSILNGKPMSHSSDTDSQSDGSGSPSLEIISDTEEWITDSDNTEQKPNISTINQNMKKSKKGKKLPTNNSVKTKSAAKLKSAATKNVDLDKIKSEKEPSSVQNPQGESLLDLLELEMRARAIRALIRKEEDIIPNADASSQAAATNTSSTTKPPITSAITDPNQINKELDKNFKSDNYKQVLEKSEIKLQNLKTNINDEDEDEVVLITKPTPTIELLSSDSEVEDSSGHANKFDNKVEASVITISHENSDNGKINENSTAIVDVISVNKNANKVKIVNEKNNEKISKLEENKNCEELDIEEEDNNKDKSNTNSLSDTVDSKNNKTPMSDRLNDYEEIIDLDDYSNDIDDIEHEEKNIIDKDSSTNDNVSLNSDETWATRYYQTDNVQNVIKESKIQSEIRKRFRERQKLSKLNNNGNNSNDNDNKGSSNKQASGVDDTSAESIEIKSGSVEEYLALKNYSNANANDVDNLISSTNSDDKVCENPMNKLVDNTVEKNNEPSTSLDKLIVCDEQTPISSDN